MRSVGFLVGVVLLGCGGGGAGGEAWDPEGSSGSTGEQGPGQSSDPASAGASGTTHDEGSSAGESPDDSSAGGSQCESGPVPPELQPEQTQWFCPEGDLYDAAYRLCVGGAEARGPFTPAMIQACEDCGATGCTEDDWPEERARALRGTGDCPPGTTPQGSVLCVDEDHAWGPFTPTMVAGCKEAGGGDQTCESMRWAREFAEALAPFEGEWSWVLPDDLGLRDDSAGGGHFGASRLNNPGGHSGIDILAPVGTPLLAACSGSVLAGTASGYGNYVQIACPIPDSVSDGASLWASVFYAHMDTLEVSSGDTVEAAQSVGTVGKTGNAGGSSVNPHVHFEIAIHDSEQAALGESHASSDHSDNAAGASFAALIDERCWTPQGLDPLTGPSRKGRRPDPFMALACLAETKPDYMAPSNSLQSAPVPWSDHYSADYDVDAWPQ